MAAKLTFSAKLDGMEKVIDLLKQAEQRMNDFGKSGSYSLEGADKRLKDLTGSIESITKSQAGMGGLFKSFDELNKKSNEFLGKSYKGIVDAMKLEAKTFETEADKIINKIREAEKELNSFKSRRSAMKEQDYQEGVSSRQKEITQYHAEAVAVRTQQHETEQQAKLSSPINEKFYDAMASRGMSQFATVEAAYKYGPRIVGAALAATATVGKVLEATGEANLREDYTKETDSYLAQRQLRLDMAQDVQSYKFTSALLKQTGLGLEQRAGESDQMKMKESGQRIWQNPWVQSGLAGGTLLGAGSALGIGLGGSQLLTALGLGALGATGIGTVALGVGALGAGYMAYNRAQAIQKTPEQIHAENLMALRIKDKEAYGLVGDTSGGYFKREADELQLGQRQFGVESTHNLVTKLAEQGASMDKANPAINMLYQQGVNPAGLEKNAELAATITRNERFGFTENMQRAVVRDVALNKVTPTQAQDKFLEVAAGAGLTKREDTAARSTFGEYTARLAEQHGAGQDMGTVGAPLAAVIQQNAPTFNKVEGVQHGIQTFETVNKNFENRGNALNTIAVSKLRSLGVENAVAIDTFMDMKLTEPNTHQAIANYTGKSVEEVRKVLGEIADVNKRMFETLVGPKELDKLNKATGGDIATLKTEGKRAFENTQQGAVGYFEAQKTMLTSGGSVDKPGSGRGKASTVEAGFETTKDKEDVGKSMQQISTDDQMRRILSDTGKTVTEELTKAIVQSFTTVTEEVRKAGDRLVSDQNKAKVVEQKGFAPVTVDSFVFPGTKAKPPNTSSK